MSKVLHVQSTLTERYQTTIPAPVRKALEVHKHDKIEYSIDKGGNVVMSRAEKDDPLIKHFLLFIADDIQKHPEHVSLIDSSLYLRAKKLTEGVDIELDSPLPDED